MQPKHLKLTLFFLILSISACSSLPLIRAPKISTQTLINSYYYTSKNETLALIAERKKLSLKTLVRINPKHCSHCKIATGAWILIATDKINLTGDLYYKTHKKDTLGKLAEHFQISVHSLLKANNLRLKDGLRIGQILRLPIGARDKVNYIFPIKNPKISYSSYFRDFRMRPGLVFAAAENSSIFAIEAGEVIFAKHIRRLGKVLIVQHPHKRQSVYAYCADFLVKEGDMVRQGQKIAKVGFENKTGAYGLYFELREAGKKLSPENYLPFIKNTPPN